jgi:nicotinamidase/pyrazinamidase
MKIKETDVLVVVDAQPTFMPGGGLPVTEGDLIMPVILEMMKLFPKERRFATKDRHPLGHVSLASSFVGYSPFHLLTYAEVIGWDRVSRIAPHALFSLDQLLDYLGQVGSQMLWPDHAIEGTQEAELHHALKESDFAYVQIKGMDPMCDSYSGFFDNRRRPTGLGLRLMSIDARNGVYCGLAEDYCAGFTALDGAIFGIQPFFIINASRSVDITTLADMRARFRARGVNVLTSEFLM